VFHQHWPAPARALARTVLLVERRLEDFVPRQLLVDRVLPFAMHSVVVPQASAVATVVPIDDVVTTMEISHAEEAATLDEEIAELQMDVEWGDAVEQRIQESFAQREADDRVGETEVAPSASGSAQIFLLRFGSAPRGADSWEDFRRALLRGPQFKPCLDALANADLDVELPQGALMLVGPQQYAIARRELVGLELHSFHMVIAEDLEYLLAEVLASLPFQRRPKIKQGERGRRPLRSAGSSVDEPVAEGSPSCAEDDILWALRVERTFLCCVPMPRDAWTVVQSTTEAVAQSEAHYGHSRGTNPRRTTRAGAA